MGQVRRLVLAVFIDAFGYKVMNRTPFLDEVLKVKVPLKTVLGYSSACDPTILTGCLPREHGHFSFFYYSPASSPFWVLKGLGWLPHAISERARFRRFVSSIFARLAGWDGYFQLYNFPFKYLHLFDYSEKRNIYGPKGIIGGQRTFLDHIRSKGLPFFLADFRRPEEENAKALLKKIRERAICFAYLMLGGLDNVMHTYGPSDCRVDQKVRAYEGMIRQFLEASRSYYEEVRLHIFSDHGMAEVKEAFDLMGHVEGLGLGFGKDYVAVYDSTMARFWFLKEPARDLITNHLVKVRCGRILSKRELETFGCDFEGDRYGEVIFLMDPGVVIHPSFMGRSLLKGMHGYEPEHEDSVAAYATNVELERVPEALTDLYGLLCKEIELLE